MRRAIAVAALVWFVTPLAAAKLSQLQGPARAVRSVAMAQADVGPR